MSKVAAKHTGFTIVELLIVIVVIGILAAIVIVAYNGISQNARISTLQADLHSSYTVLTNDNTTTGTYPATLSAANGGKGLTPSSGNTYSYIVNNTLSPAYYCLGETNTVASLTYFVTSTSNIPQAGGCSVTNLVPNPSVESSLSNWGYYPGTGGVGSSSQVGSGAYSGTSKIVGTWTTAPSGNVIIDTKNTVSGLVGQSVCGSLYATASWSNALFLADVVFWDASNNVTGEIGSSPTLISSSWTRLSIVGTVPANTTTVEIRARQGGGSNPIVGSQLSADAAMLTVGTSCPNYADGSSPGWIWNGTANASTSTGPPL